MTSFRESQNMFALWLLLIILPIFGYQVYQDINNPIGILKNPAIIITGIVLIGLMLLRLKTNYTSEGIYIVFIPFRLEKVYTLGYSFICLCKNLWYFRFWWLGLSVWQRWKSNDCKRKSRFTISSKR
ncbi:Uncharacterised protein [Sphingobacterium daejeonense]|nr:Uncharacterised protein [Sphingobacterium daejeonense]